MTIRNKVFLFALLCIALLATGQKVPQGRGGQIVHTRKHQLNAPFTRQQRLAAEKMLATKRRSKQAANGMVKRLKSAVTRNVGPTIGFQSALALPVGGEPFGDPVVGDFNKDGKLDAAVLVYNYNGGEEDSSSYAIATVLGNGDGTFQPAVLTGLSDEPAFLLAGEMNGDGKTELVTGTSEMCTVWTYQGNGTFSGQSFQWSESYYPYGAVLMDVNGDGKLDLVMQDFEEDASHVVVMYGGGNGTLSFSSNIAIDNWNDAPTFAYLNGQTKGMPDLVGIDDNNGLMEVFLWNGEGYTGHVDVPLATGSTIWGQIAIGDVNGDGMPDILISGSGDDDLFGPEYGYNYGCIAVFLNQGKGVFLPGLTEWAGFYTRGMTLADINGDGKAEVLTTNEDGADLTVLIADSDGWFSAPEVGYAIGGYPQGNPAVADFNGDGKLEVMAHDRDMNLVYLPTLGNGVFTAATNYYSRRSQSTNYWYGEGFSVATGDFNGDGHTDIVLGKYDSGNDMGVSVFLGNSDGSFQPGITYGDSESQAFVAVADFNGDGKLDILATDNEYGNLLVYPGKGNGTFDPPLAFATNANAWGGPDDLVVADFNKDGKPDVAVFNEESGSIGILINDGDGSAATVTNYQLTGTGAMLAAGDLRGKGIIDIVAAEYYGNAIAILLGNGDGTFQAPVEIPLNLESSGEPWAVAIGDINGDGKPDLAFTLQGGDSNNMQYIAVMTGHGDGTFNAPVIYPATTRNTAIDSPLPRDIHIADVNNDGKPDLVYSNTEYGSVAILYNKGNDSDKNPLFYDPIEFVSGGYVMGLAVTDLNGDGALDYVAAGDDFPGITVGYNVGGNSLAITSSKNPAAPTDTITLSAQVKATINGVTTIPTGNVVVTESGKTLGAIALSKGTGTLHLANLAVGSHNLIANYSGDAHFVPQSQKFSQIVMDYSFAANKTSATVKAGNAASFTLTVTPENGFNSEVSFACESGLGKGMSCTFNPNLVTPTGGAVKATLTVATTGSSLNAMLPTNQRPGGEILWASLGSMGALGIVLMGAGSRRRTWWIVLGLLGLVLMLGIVGCGSSSHVSSNSNATPAGQYTVQVKASASGYTAKTTTLTITVQ